MIAGGAISGALLIGELIAGFLLTAILLFFFLKDGDRLWSWLVQLAPTRQHNKESTRMIGFIVAGLIIGLLARLLLPGRQKIGLLWTLVLGVLGSVIGGVIANLIGSGDIFELNVIGFIVAVLAAVGLLAAAERSRLATGSQRGRLDH